MFCVDRCRAKLFPLLVLIRTMGALCFLHNVRLHVRWIPSERNASDEASRYFDPELKAGIEADTVGLDTGSTFQTCAKRRRGSEVHPRVWTDFYDICRDSDSEFDSHSDPDLSSFVSVCSPERFEVSSERTNATPEVARATADSPIRSHPGSSVFESPGGETSSKVSGTSSTRGGMCASPSDWSAASGRALGARGDTVDSEAPEVQRLFA